MVNIKLSKFRKALDALAKGIYPPPLNDRERDGAIQRFEFTLDISWKTGKKILESMGIKSESQKLVVRDLGQQGLIDNVNLWIDFIDSRNETSHLYEDDVAKLVYSKVEFFYVEAEKLYSKFDEYVSSTKD
jgi:nucleotidyltransferase substrate binding protein (TIGR01987 family)